ncbi:MAG: OmpH family outer membrane protein [Bacteroidetes bacterium]|nr:OmpH family outer membrane protein [Bacteroidota bacterium]
MNITKKAAIAILTFTLGGLLTINAQKIAHVNLDSLISTMPEAKQAKEIAQNYYKSIESEILSMQTEFETKYQKYMQDENTMSDLVKKNRQEELSGLQKKIEDFRGQAQQDYQRKTGELMQPITDKAMKAIEAVAKEGGFKYVLDTSPGRTNVLYHEQGDDVLLVAKKKLDSMPLAKLPGADAANNPKNGTPKTNNNPKTPQGGAVPKGK